MKRIAASIFLTLAIGASLGIVTPAAAYDIRKCLKKCDIYNPHGTAYAGCVGRCVRVDVR